MTVIGFIKQINSVAGEPSACKGGKWSKLNGTLGEHVWLCHGQDVNIFSWTFLMIVDRLVVFQLE